MLDPNFKPLGCLNFIEVQSVNDHLAVPTGVIPRFARQTKGQWIVYAENWTSQVYDNRYFDFYPLLEANKLYIKAGDHGSTTEQLWFIMSEPTPTLSGLKIDGVLNIRSAA